MPYKELHRFSDDLRILIAMCESVNDVRYTVSRTLELIEQSLTMLRELDSQRLTTDEARSSSLVQSDRQQQKVRLMQRYHYNLLELARICSRQAGLGQTEDVARTLRRMAGEYVQEAGKLDDGKDLPPTSIWFV
jgi:hypothetical protein